MTNVATTRTLQSLTAAIHKIIKPDAIYLLGWRNNKQATGSIYHPLPFPNESSLSHVYLLVVAPLYPIAAQDWLDKTEAYCNRVIPATIIIKDKALFRERIAEANPFICRILNQADCLYHSDDHKKEDCHAQISKQEADALRAEGLYMFEKFMAAASLFRTRKHDALACFMLHQAAEISLHIILKSATGFDYRTSNIKRLLQYASLVHAELFDWLTDSAKKEKKLLFKLQETYSNSTPGKHLSLSSNELGELSSLIGQLKRYLLPADQNHVT